MERCASTPPRRPIVKTTTPTGVVGRMAPIAENTLEGVTVLVVEDDTSNAQLVSILLSEAGANVIVVGSAEEALLRIPITRPRAIVVDLVLPGISGFALVRLLKSAAATRDIGIAVVSSLNGPEAERIALETDCAFYMRKPIDCEAFVSRAVSLWGVRK